MIAGGVTEIKCPSRTAVFRIWNIADVHLGNAGCAEDRLKEDVEEIADDPYSYWFGGGDYIDAIHYKDKRFDPASMDPKITVRQLGSLGKSQKDQVVKLFKPIAGKCLGMLFGNHEYTYQLSSHQQDLHGAMCVDLGVQNLGYSAFKDVVFDRSSSKYAIRFFLHHGCGAAQTEGGKLNKLIQFMERFEADVYMIGHVHDVVGKRIVMLKADRICRKIEEKYRIGVITGSYLKTYKQDVTGYGEIKGYKPTVLGATHVSINPGKNKIWGEI